MPSTFYGLNIGYSGLTAYNAAITTTGNNIANVETKGYSRQHVNQTAGSALRTYTSYGMTGSGVTVKGVEQMRDEYYDIKYRKANASHGEYAIKADYAAQIENYFSDDGEKIRGFSTLYDNVFRSMEDLKANPGDTATRVAFIGQTQSLTDYFNTIYEEMQSLQEDVNDQIKVAADEINSIAEQIAALNKQINIIELKGVVANELRDQRANLVDELSEYVDVDIIEDPIYSTDEVNPFTGMPEGEPTGAFRYQVTISGNQTLVDGYEYRTLNCVAIEDDNKTNQSDATGLYNLQWYDTKMNYYPVGNNYSGKLNGLLQMRDGNNNEYFHGNAAKCDLAKKTVTIGVNSEYLTDVTKCTIPETGTIIISSTEYRYTGWTANFAKDGSDIKTDEFGNPIIESYTFNLDSDKNSEAKLNKLGALVDEDKSARIGINVDYQGIPYYMEQMNEWIRDFSQNFNEILTQDGAVDENDDPARNLFVAKDASGNVEQFDMTAYKKADHEGTSYRIESSDNGYYKMTAGTFEIDRSISENAAYLATHTGIKEGQDKQDIVEQLIDLQTNKDRMSFRGCSSSEFLQCVLADIALNANSANTFEKKYEDLGAEIDTMRMSISSVDNDEEAANLVKFQNAYVLASKMISTFNEIYNRLILETGV